MNITIYKIFNKEYPENVYIGSTKNLINRIYLHKSNCNNILSKNYNSKLYLFIREKGGFNNFIFETIETYECLNHADALKHERHWYDFFNPDLNTNRPLLSSEEKKELQKQTNIKYYINNKEYANNKRKLNYLNNKDRDLAYQKAYREKKLKEKTLIIN